MTNALPIEAVNDIEGAIIDGARTALLNNAHSSSDHFRPKFITNDKQLGRKIISSIEQNLNACCSFDFSVAFVTNSGIQPLKQTLQELESAQIPGRILTTDYLSFSEPSALEFLDSLSNIEVRMYPVGKTKDYPGFHTKGYLFHYQNQLSKVLVGSANLTASALANNHEWNIQITSTENGELLKEIQNEFDNLWDKSLSLKSYINTYRQIYEDKKRVISQQPIISFEQASLEPNSMQISFISNLSDSIDGGYKRALLISATGTGKTYASAFAVRNIQPKRLLFLAHREQVLKQSKASYERVLGPGSYGLLSGNSHNFEADYLFATMQTMGKKDILTSFKPDDFDIIVIDEVHRAGSKSYQTIMDYFHPSLYLGMTASPDRPDGFDIYKLFDNNIVQEIRLNQALEEDLLCPFHYFGITDLSINGVPIDDTTEFSYLVADERINHILDRADYFGFSGERVKGLIFCRTICEAEVLSEQFNKHRLRTMSLSGANTQEERELAIERLVADKESPYYDNKLDYLLTVDIFNEGVDIPEVNQIIMLRPTESPIVFVQQLGRGLRKSKDKDFVVILDFIGNYSNNYMIPLALSGNRSYNKDDMRKFIMEGERTISGSSSVHFDEIARERIFRSIDNSKLSITMLKESYANLKHKLGRIPRMTDFFEHGEMDPMLFIDRKRSYYRFINDYDKEFANVLNEDEHVVLEFLSRYIANGMRPHELIALKQLAEVGHINKAKMSEKLIEYFNLTLDDASFDSAARVLNGSFVNSRSEKDAYSEINLIEFEGENIGQGKTLREMLASDNFKQAFLDIINFGLRRYEEKYLAPDRPFKLYEKYMRKDACRLLNWPTDDSSTVYGYRVKYNTCPIFVTYNKEEDITSSTQYEDRFVDPDTFSWMTRSRLTIDSPEVQKIINAKETGIEVHLFAKKSDNEGGDFYYLGPVEPKSWKQTTIQDDDGNELPIVNFLLQLETTVKDDIYEYFTGNAA